MVGYIMTLDNLDSLRNCIKTGAYSTNISELSGKWKTYHKATFADF